MIQSKCVVRFRASDLTSARPPAAAVALFECVVLTRQWPLLQQGATRS